ncbi:MAG: hypothetical protein M3Z54_09115 [Gemmatimonadota bacterium]|nr:hypothetical protein [Gemmatimonadota bacterium]
MNRSPAVARYRALWLALPTLLVGSSGCDRPSAAALRTDINGAFSVEHVRVAPDSLNAYIADHQGFTSLGGQMRCAYAPLDQDAGRVFVWAICIELLPSPDRQELVRGSAMSLPVALQVETQDDRARIVGIAVPQMGDQYGTSIRRIFPESLWPRIFPHTEIENARGRALAKQLQVEAVERFRLPSEAARTPPQKPGASQLRS